MKLIKKIIVLLSIFSINMVFAGWPVPKWCPLNWYENYDLCPEIVIWKVISGKNNLNFDGSNIESYLLWNNYFFNNDKLYKIDEKIVDEEWWLKLVDFDLWDVVIYDVWIFNYSWIQWDKEYEISKENMYKEIFWIDKLKISNSYWNYYRVTCENNEIKLDNKNSNYDLWFVHQEIVDYNLSKQKVKEKLQLEIQTCSKFNELFWLGGNKNNIDNIQNEREEKNIINTDLTNDNKTWFEKIIDFIKIFFNNLFKTKN